MRIPLVPTVRAVVLMDDAGRSRSDATAPGGRSGPHERSRRESAPEGRSRPPRCPLASRARGPPAARLLGSSLRVAALRGSGSRRRARRSAGTTHVRRNPHPWGPVRRATTAGGRGATFVSGTCRAYGECRSWRSSFATLSHVAQTAELRLTDGLSAKPAGGGGVLNQCEQLLVRQPDELAVSLSLLHFMSATLATVTATGL